MKATEFTTKSGKVFDLSIDYEIAKAIDSSDFSELTDKKICFIDQTSVEMFQELSSNSNLVFAIIWCIIQDQVRDNKYYECQPEDNTLIEDIISCKYCKNIIDYQNSIRLYKLCDSADILFLKDLDGKSIQQAKAAFKEGLYDFFPQMRTYLSEYEKVKEKLVEEITQKHSQLTQAIIRNTERIVREEIEKINDSELLELLESIEEESGQKLSV